MEPVSRKAVRRMSFINESDYKPEVLQLLWQPWTIELRPYSDGGYFARVIELPGCMTEGDTREEVIEMIDEARAEWLSSAMEHGDPIPEPRGSDEYSGKIFVRTSPQLHRKVAQEASKQGISMSQWVAEVLAETLGVKDAVRNVTVDLMEALKTSVTEASRPRRPTSKRKHPDEETEAAS